MWPRLPACLQNVMGHMGQLRKLMGVSDDLHKVRLYPGGVGRMVGRSCLPPWHSPTTTQVAAPSFAAAQLADQLYSHMWLSRAILALCRSLLGAMKRSLVASRRRSLQH